MEIELRERARSALEKATSALLELEKGRGLPPYAEEALNYCRAVLGDFDFLKSNYPIFPEEWGWQKYEPHFREWAWQLAGLLEEEEQKGEDDLTVYPDLIEDFILQKQDQGLLPTKEQMEEKGQALRVIQDNLEAIARQELKRGK